MFKIITRKLTVSQTLFWPFVLSFIVLASGCASVADKTESTATFANTNKQAAETSAKETSAGHKSTADNIPGTELDSKLLYDLLLAEMALQRNDYDLAFKKYYEAAKKTRDSRLAKKVTRVTLFSKNDEQTFKAVKLWSELQPDNIDVLQIYASSLINRKQDQEALKYLKKIMIKSRDFDEGFQRAVGLLDTIKEPSRLTSLFAELAKGHEDRAIVKLNQAKLSFKLGDNVGAERHLNEALAINPDYLEASMLKIQLLKKQHRPQEAIALLEKLLKKQPENINLGLELVRMLVAQKQVKKADRQIKCLASMDINPEVIFAISLLAIEINQLDDAKSPWNGCISTACMPVKPLILLLNWKPAGKTTLKLQPGLSGLNRAVILLKPIWDWLLFIPSRKNLIRPLNCWIIHRPATANRVWKSCRLKLKFMLRPKTIKKPMRFILRH